MRTDIALLLSASILFLLPAYGQLSSKDTQYIASHFERNGARFSVRTALARKAFVTPNKTYRPGASNFISLGMGIDYCFHLGRSVSIITGLHGLWHGSNFTFFVHGKDFQPPLGFDLIETGPTSGDLQ